MEARKLEATGRQNEVLEYKLSGDYCPSCMDKVVKALTASANILNVNLFYNIDKLQVELIDNSQIDLTEIDKEVEKTLSRYEPSASACRANKDSLEDTSDKIQRGQPKWYQDRRLQRILSGVALGIFGYLTAEVFVLNGYISLALYIIGYWLVGASVLTQAGKNILSGQVFDENFLMSIATIGAFLIGEWPEAIAVMAFYKVGEYLQNRAVSSSKSSIRELLELKSAEVKIKTSSGQIEKIAAEEVKPGDNLIISAGEKIPVDGKILAGNSALNTSALTGESRLLSVSPGDEVSGGMINSSGSLVVEAIRPYSESAVARIIKLVEEAAARKSTTEKFITRFARYYTPAVVGIAILVALLPPLITGASYSVWIYRALVFLVISCPCALVISIPLSFFSGIGVAAKQGILVQGSNFLEVLTDINTVIFDKTGTLTEGKFTLSNIETAGEYQEEELLLYAIAAEQYSNHALARALQKEADNFNQLAQVDNTEEYPGKGLEAMIAGKQILLGSREWLVNEKAMDFPGSGDAGAEILIAIAGQPAGVLYFQDNLKENIKTTIDELQKVGVKRQIILSGDRTAEVAAVADKLGLEYQAELLPEDKLRLLEEIKAGLTGKDKVAYLGDGINDSPALARADIGIAMGALGTDVAIESADVVIMDDSPAKLLQGIEISEQTKKLIWQNIFMALGIKATFMVLGTLGITGLWPAVFADVGVTILAIFNSLRILWQYRKEDL
ncbi:MAG: heavy metal translocating P-type ATPase [Bacillota bacterium]